MRYLHLFKNCIKFKFLIFVLATLGPCVEATLYSFGSGTDDINLDFSSRESARIDLEYEVPMFGDGVISRIWINSFGSISLNSTTSGSSTSSRYNVIMTPFSIPSGQGSTGTVYYAQTEEDATLFGSISRDISAFSGGEDFIPAFALKVTWSNVPSLNDSETVNSFQLILTTDSTRTYLIFNYSPVQWVSVNGSFAVAGIHATGNNLEFCSHFLPGSGSPEIRLLASTSNVIGSRGRHVIDITDPLNCTAAFQSLCREFPRAGRGVFQPRFQLFNSGEMIWNFFLQFSCKPGLVIAPDVTSQRIECSYDSDYYEYEWESNTAPRCLDLNSTFAFVTRFEVANRSASFLHSEQLNNMNVEMISRLLENVNVTDVVVGMPSPSSNTSSNNTIVEFTTYVPPFTNRKLTNNSLAEKLMVELNVSALSVVDMTGRCLQSCLCRNLKDPVLCRGKGRPLVPPDACCGECGGPQKPYASSLKACCDNRVLYDPTLAVCCNGRVRKGSHCPP